MVCDSTNAMVEGHSGSEADVRTSLAALIRTIRGRRGGHLLRQQRRAGGKRGAGRPERRAFGGAGGPLAAQPGDAAARDTGYLKDRAGLRAGGRGRYRPRRQPTHPGDRQPGAKPRSALARIANDTHRNVALGEGDTVIFSSRVIPGNERAIGTVHDNLVRRGVRLMTADDHMVQRVRPSGTRRTAPAVCPGASHLRRAGAWRMAAPVGACRLGEGRGGPRRSCWRTATSSAWVATDPR